MRTSGRSILWASLLAVLAAAVPARAQILIERVVSVNKTIADGGTLMSGLTWSDANLASVSWVAVSLNFSSPYESNPMVLGDLSGTLTFGTSTESPILGTVFNRGNLSSLSQTFALADTFDGAWKDSDRWVLRITDNQAGGIAMLNNWKLSIRGQASSSGTLTLSDGERISTASDAGSATTVGSVVSLSGTTDAEALANKVLTFSGGLSGSGTLRASTEAGGKIVLSGDSASFAGLVRVAGAGTTEIADIRALGTGQLQQSNSQSTLRLNFAGTMTNRLSVYNVSFATNGATLAGQVTVNNTDFDVASGDTNTVSGEVDGTGTVTKIGAGTLVLSGTNNSYTDITDVRNGTLRAVTVANSSNNSSIGAGTGLTIGSSNTAGTFVHTGTDTTNSMNRQVLVGSSGGTFSVEHSNSRVTLTGTLANQTTNAATLTKSGAGTMAFGSGANVTVSTIAVQQGTLLLGAANTIGTDTEINLAGGTLDTAGFADTVGRLVVSAASSIKGLSTGTDFLFSDMDLSTYSGSGGYGVTLVGSYSIGNTINLFNKAQGVWSAGDLTSLNNFASKVSFSSGDLQASISFSGGYTGLTVAAIPEPRVYAAAAGLVMLIGWAEFKRRRGKKLGVSR
jgi:autotransporter-associated beta strand protein